MTECLHCKHCEVVDHPKYKYHLIVNCKLKGESFDLDNPEPVACHEYVEDVKITRACNYILDNWHTNTYLDGHGFWQEEQVWNGR